MIAAVTLVGCQGHWIPEPLPDEAKADALGRLKRIETPVTLASSDLLGLTEAEILQKNGLQKLNPEHGTTNKKWFSGGIIHFPRIGGGYVWERCHILTFEKGEIVKHEIIDRPTAHVSLAPAQP